MSRFGTKQRDITTATPATATVARTIAITTMPKEISGIPVVIKTTTIGVSGEIYANFVHANDHYVKIDNLPKNIEERVVYIRKMLISFPSTATIEQYTVTR